MRCGFRALAIIAVAITGTFAWANFGKEWERVRNVWVVPMRVKIVAKPFDLSRVCLLESPFRRAMERDGEYLLPS